MSSIYAAVVCAALWLIIPDACSQTYPAKTIRLIVPFPPGGGVDAVGRVIAQALSEQLGQPEGLLALIKSEIQKWASVTQIAKLTPE
ncbi:MAG: hypothetical protein ACXWCY_27550 [Burkholderiales bacterium]